MDGHTLAKTLWLGLAVAFWAGFFSQFNSSPQWVKTLRNKKPFGCPLCMSFWVSLIIVVMDALTVPGIIVWSSIGWLFLAFLFKAVVASAMVSILLLSVHQRVETIVIK